MSEDKERESYQKISDKDTKTLSLTIPELLFIDDNVSLMIDGSDFETMIPLRPAISSAIMLAPIDFIDKIGRALVQILSYGKGTIKNRSITISVSEMELYMLREMCITTIDYFGYSVGLSLKKKVLTALYKDKQRNINLLEQLLKDIDLGEK
mgnify:FL=1